MTKRYTIADHYPAGMSECESSGIFGNCGVRCAKFQDFDCPNCTKDEHCEEFIKEGLCGKACYLYQQMRCTHHPLEEQVNDNLSKYKFSKEEIELLINNRKVLE